MQFQINAGSQLPIYRQLANQIREGVARGQLEPEERLPSVRELSRELVVNPNTIARAYTELERAGVLNTRQGLGVFVARPSTDLTKKARVEQLLTLIDPFLIEAVYLGFSADDVVATVSERVSRFQWSHPAPKTT
ncbi:MAG: GntR family transcriptional regulator [Planctomycetaceae bacterium]|nr:GntR family transcriptional regulator [Planctomycetaceae bacterium]